MLIGKFDYISPLITLYYKGETRHSSIFSGLISIILAIFVIIIGVFVSFDFLFKRNPTSFYSKKEIRDIGTIELSNHFFFHYLSFIEDDNLHFDNKSFSSIGINNISYYDFLIEDISEYNFSHWKYERCQILNNFKQSESLIINDKNFNKSLCLSKDYDKEKNKFINYFEEDFPFPILENNKDLDYKINYGIILKLCENNTIYNNNSCYNYSQIISKAFGKEREYIINYFSNFVDVENYQNPINKQLTKKQYTYNPYFIQINHISLLQTNIKTSDGIFFNDNKIITTQNIDYFFEEYLYNYLNIFFQMIEIEMTNKEEIYHRDYKKFQDIIGSFDGIIELFILIIKTLNNFFYHDYRLVNDFNEVIGRKVEKIKTNHKIEINNSSFINNPKILYNNFILENKTSTKLSGIPNISPIRKFCTLKTKIKKNSEPQNISKSLTNNFNYNKINNYTSKILLNFEEFSWLQYINTILCYFNKKNHKYYDKILLLRKKILSEERLLKNYWKIKKLNNDLFEFKIINESQSLIPLSEH